MHACGARAFNRDTDTDVIWKIVQPKNGKKVQICQMHFHNLAVFYSLAVKVVPNI